MSLPASSPLPHAFKLVHRILTSSTTAPAGLTTKEIVREAVALYQSENGQSQPGSGSSAPLQSQERVEQEQAQVKGKGKGKGKGNVASAPLTSGQGKGVNLVPEGHPFVSTSFLKHRVLPILESQNLITKTVRPSSSTSSSNPGPSGTHGRKSFIWRLSAQRAPKLSTPAWDLPAHWDRLIAGEMPGKLAAEQRENFAARQAEEHQRGLDSGKLRRTEQEIWAWEARVPGLTTKVERGNLNKRRAEARPKKERKRVEQWDQLFGGVEEEARQRLGVSP